MAVFRVEKTKDFTIMSNHHLRNTELSLKANMNGSQQICFTDSAGKALFSIPDNGLLCLFYGNGDRHFAVCHRLDDTHAEIDGVNYSLPDFAKRMKHNQISFAPA